MGLATGALPAFPWDTLAPFAAIAREHPRGIVDLSVGTPVDPTPVVVRDALIAASDAVIVAAPTAHHHEIGLAVLRAGRHLFVEKPIAATLEQADEMIAEAAARRLVLQVGHIERYSAAIVALREAMGDFAPRSLDATRVAPLRPRSLDISVVLDLMIHDIDLVLSLAAKSALAWQIFAGSLAA